MPISKQDKNYAMPELTMIDPKVVNIDRVLIQLLPLLKYGTSTIATPRGNLITTNDIIKFIDNEGNNLLHFSMYKPIIESWLESDLLSLVNRGTDKQQIAAPMPLHLNTYLLRNRKYCDDYGVANQLFSLLFYESPQTIDLLRDFLSRGIDKLTDQYDGKTDLDIETLLLIRILNQAGTDHEDKRKQQDVVRPLCTGQGYLLGNDIQRLLAYQYQMPTLALISYLKNIMALHAGLYILRLFNLLPELVQGQNATNKCLVKCDLVHCNYQPQILVDIGEDYRSHMAQLARLQYSQHQEQMHQYIRSHMLVKKLSEFADELQLISKIKEKPSLEEIIALRDFGDQDTLRIFFKSRIKSLMDDDDGDQDSRIVGIYKLGLSEIDTYIEMIFMLRHKYHQSFYNRFLDSVFQKNSENCLLRQGSGRISNKRRYSMGSGLLETLVHIAVLEQNPNGQGFRSKNIRIDEFIEWLRLRYGIYISRLPENQQASIADLEALRINVQNLKNLLREIGFYTNLSDAFVSQVIKPRYLINA